MSVEPGAASAPMKVVYHSSHALQSKGSTCLQLAAHGEVCEETGLAAHGEVCEESGLRILMKGGRTPHIS